MRAIVLREMGIECEEETYRALKTCGIEDLQYLGLSELFQNGWQQRVNLDSKTLVWVPGGFSFSDDFGAGRLLAHWLKEQGFLEEVLQKGAHLCGVCNGFQALSHLGIFGKATRLQSNRPRGFINRWVKVSFADHAAKDSDKSFKLPVRHGEGRLDFEELPSNVKPWLLYQDETFTNGSKDAVAGLYARVSNSHCFGMMPHPEIALRPMDAPQTVGTSRMPKFRSEICDLNGSGFYVIQKILDLIQEGAR